MLVQAVRHLSCTHLINPLEKLGRVQTPFVHARWGVGIDNHLEDMDVIRDELPSNDSPALIPLADDIWVEIHDFEHLVGDGRRRKQGQAKQSGRLWGSFHLEAAVGEWCGGINSGPMNLLETLVDVPVSLPAALPPKTPWSCWSCRAAELQSLMGSLDSHLFTSTQFFPPSLHPPRPTQLTA